MGSTRIGGLPTLSLTGQLFGLLYDCPFGCGGTCPLSSVRQVNLSTTFYYIKSLSRDDKMWLLYRYEHCPVRLGTCAPERRRHVREEIGHGFGGKLAATT